MATNQLLWIIVILAIVIVVLWLAKVLSGPLLTILLVVLAILVVLWLFGLVGKSTNAPVVVV